MLDEVDRALIDALLADGKVTNRQLAAQTGISESVIGDRLRKLTTAGVLAFTAVVDWEAAGFEWLAVCRIHTGNRSPHDVAEEIGRFEPCVAAAVALGSYDVLGYFLVTDRAEVRQLIDRLATVIGIADVSVDLATATAVPARGRQLFLSRTAPRIRLPAPTPKLDELDVAILQALVEDSRQSSRRIARALEVSEGTVRTRIARLTESGLARVVALVEPVAMGLIGVIASVSIRADRSLSQSILKVLTAAPNVVLAALCLGSWDLHAAVTARTPAELMDTVREIQSIDGVLATDTSLMVDIVWLSSYLKRLDAT